MAPIDPRQNNVTWITPVTKIRLRRLLAVVAVSAVLVTGCSTGSAPEAERGQREDAQRTSVISDMQATYTWDLINSTPEGTPENTPEP